MQQALGLHQQVVVRFRVAHVEDRERHGGIVQAGDQRLVLRDIGLEEVRYALHPVLKGNRTETCRLLEPCLPLQE